MVLQTVKQINIQRILFLTPATAKRNYNKNKYIFSIMEEIAWWEYVQYLSTDEGSCGVGDDTV
jgi:hypothetical protein